MSVARMLTQPDGCLLHGQRNQESLEGSKESPQQVHLDLVDVYCYACVSDMQAGASVLNHNEALDVLQHWTARCVDHC